MPSYDFRCRTCRTVFTRRYNSINAMETDSPACPRCDSTDLSQLIRRVATTTTEQDRIARLTDLSHVADFDDDPRVLGQYMQRVSSEMGQDFGADYDEVADRLAAGETPELIDESWTATGED